MRNESVIILSCSMVGFRTFGIKLYPSTSQYNQNQWPPSFPETYAVINVEKEHWPGVNHPITRTAGRCHHSPPIETNVGNAVEGPEKTREKRPRARTRSAMHERSVNKAASPFNLPNTDVFPTIYPWNAPRGVIGCNARPSRTGLASSGGRFPGLKLQLRSLPTHHHHSSLHLHDPLDSHVSVGFGDWNWLVAPGRVRQEV